MSRGVWWAVGIVWCVVAVAANEKIVGPKTHLPDDDLFKDQAAFCDGCYAVVEELDKLVTKWQREAGALEDHIDAALLAVCSTERLRTYVLSPPKMNRLCSGIRSHYMEELGMAFTKKYAKKKTLTALQVFEATCRKVIPACPKGMKPMSLARKENREKAEAEKAAAEKKKKQEEKEREKSKPEKKDEEKKKHPKTEGEGKEDKKEGKKNKNSKDEL